MVHSIVRTPSRSPSTPNIGAASVPMYCSEPNAVRSNTDPESTSTYQLRISVSISNAHDVSRSAGHWKRKLRTRKAASKLRDGVALHDRFVERHTEARPRRRHELPALHARHRGEHGLGARDVFDEMRVRN